MEAEVTSRAAAEAAAASAATLAQAFSSSAEQETQHAIALSANLVHTTRRTINVALLLLAGLVMGSGLTHLAIQRLGGTVTKCQKKRRTFDIFEGTSLHVLLN